MSSKTGEQGVSLKGGALWPQTGSWTAHHKIYLVYTQLLPSRDIIHRHVLLFRVHVNIASHPTLAACKEENQVVKSRNRNSLAKKLPRGLRVRHFSSGERLKAKAGNVV